MALVCFREWSISYNVSKMVCRFTSLKRGNPLSFKFCEIFLAVSMYFITGENFARDDYFSFGDGIVLFVPYVYTACLHVCLNVSFLASAVLDDLENLSTGDVEFFSDFIYHLRLLVSEADH